MTVEPATGEARLATLIDDLASQGWSIQTGFAPEALCAQLRAECDAVHAAGGFHPAGVGKGQSVRLERVRGDEIHWLEGDTAGPATRMVLASLKALQNAVNRNLYLGLVESELHFAVYPPGAGYQRHVDRFRDDDRRTLTVILYLNPADWCAEDGGQLRFWPAENATPFDIHPQGGTLVCFLSERFPHQVLPARRTRYSLTGWMKRR